jgi:hypothetical protein
MATRALPRHDRFLIVNSKQNTFRRLTRILCVWQPEL